jgi:hypothetical protein
VLKSKVLTSMATQLLQEHNFENRAATLGTGIHRRAEVVSDVNLNSFIHWASTAKMNGLKDVLRRVNVRKHRSSLDGVVQDAPLRVQGLLMTTKPCNRQECIRCETGKGGYFFSFCHKSWTPRLALVQPKGFPASPDLARFLCGRVSFPHGLLRGQGEKKSAAESGLEIEEALKAWETVTRTYGVSCLTGRTDGIKKSDKELLRKKRYQVEASLALAYANDAKRQGLSLTLGLEAAASVSQDTPSFSSHNMHRVSVAMSEHVVERIGRHSVAAHLPHAKKDLDKTNVLYNYLCAMPATKGSSFSHFRAQCAGRHVKLFPQRRSKR